MAGKGKGQMSSSGGKPPAAGAKPVKESGRQGGEKQKPGSAPSGGGKKGK